MRPSCNDDWPPRRCVAWASRMRWQAPWSCWPAGRGLLSPATIWWSTAAPRLVTAVEPDKISKVSMFLYFPTNYVWNLSVDLAIEMGARIGEIEEMCAPLMEASKQPDAEGTRAFAQSWIAMGDKLCALADEDEQRRRLISAGDKLQRAAIY